MGTAKRERQKANRQQRRVEDARAEKRSRAVRTVVQWGLGILAAVIAVLVIFWATNGFGSDDAVGTNDDRAAVEMVAPSPPPRSAPSLSR